MARQPEEIRDFLLCTSILERLCAPLCDALTGRDDGYKILSYVEQANLFVVPLDPLDSLANEVPGDSPTTLL